MIIKKPYAFLIRHFKLIHFILFLCMLYIGIKTISIYTYLGNYISTGSEFLKYNASSSTINILLFISIILCLVICSIIYYLLALKNKSRRSYIFICIIYIVLFVYFIYISTLFNTLETNYINKDTLKFIKDLNLIILLPQFIFAMIIFSRSLGFNVRQFEFQNDIAQIQIESKDNEEIELTFGKSNYKILREIRKIFRLMKYFILEHKFIVTLVVSIILILSFSMFFFNNTVVNIKYKEKEDITVSSITYNVNSSYITKYDLNQKVINNNKYYLIVKISLKNNLDAEYYLDSDNFRLEVNDKTIIPVFSFKTEFSDIAKPYVSNKVVIKEDSIYNVIFEINKEDKTGNYIFKIKNINPNTTKEIKDQYKNVVILPVDLDKSIKKETVNLSGKLNFKDTVIGNYEFGISDYKIQKSFNETYKFCIEERNCSNNILIIKTENVNNMDMSVIKLSGSIKVDENQYISQSIKTFKKFISEFGFIKYEINGINKTTKLNEVDVKRNFENIGYFSVPSEILRANKIELLINIRGNIYTFILK